MEHLRYWVNNLLNSIENEVDKDVSNRIIEKCGRICAKECGAINEVEKIIEDLRDKDIDMILEKMNQAEVGGGKLYREGNRIYGTYDECYCPSQSLINNDNYCSCTQGWVKEVFGKIFDKNITVTLEQSIARGDKICRFKVEY